MIGESHETLSIPSRRLDEELYDLETAAELSGMHPEMILEFCRAHVVTLHRRGDSPHFDSHGIHRLRQIETLLHERSMSLRSIRFVMELMERLESTEREVRKLRERMR